MNKSGKAEPFVQSEVPPSAKLVGTWLPRLLLHPAGMVAVFVCLAGLTTMGVIGTSKQSMDFLLE